jgi:hypothetical protein
VVSPSRAIAFTTMRRKKSDCERMGHSPEKG